jgi:sterol desaturase/sphingolipid hydroxylase (fatty acid hydroxylase superfamily)
MTLTDFDLGAAVTAWLSSLRGLLSNPESPFWWPSLVAAGVAGVIVAVVAGAKLRDVPREMFPHSRRDMLREFPVDVACFLAGSTLPFLLGPVLFLLSWVGTSVGVTLLLPFTGMPTGSGPAPSWPVLFVAAVVAFVVGDFMLYWTHRIFHQFPLLWRAHKLHHAPAVLTPLTAFRFWPQESFVHMGGNAFGTGIGLGACSAIAGTAVSPLTVLGVNVVGLAWGLAFSQLRHSHVPMPFPRWLSYVLVSPQMHQVHHSSDPAHYDRNFGTALALWDWAFGTLYLPRPTERFHFGLEPPEPPRPA